LRLEPVPLDLVCAVPDLIRDVRAVTDPRNDTSFACLTELAIAISVLECLPAQEQTVGVQGEELVHAANVLSPDPLHATGQLAPVDELPGTGPVDVEGLATTTY
jgi:hypothetical protein